MKKIHVTGIFTLITILLATLLMPACQPTPEDPAVVGKDQQAMLSAAAQSPADGEKGRVTNVADVNAPETYKFSTTGAGGKLTVTADATVTLPEAETLPTAKVVPRGFTQDMVSGMLKYFYGDTPYYANDKRRTKDEIEDQILLYQKNIANGAYDEAPELKEEIEGRIKELQKQIATAPEVRDAPKLSDGTMTQDVVTGEYTLDVSSIDSKGNSIAWFVCNSSTADVGNPFEPSFSGLSYSNYSSNNDDYWNFTMDKATRIYDDSDITDDLKTKLGITFEQAKGIVQELLDAADVEGMQCTAAYVIDDHGTGNYDGYTGPASDYAIRLFYTGSVNGAPVLPTRDCQSAKDAYDYTWPYEMLEATVTDDGIIEVSWDEPCTVPEVITDSTNIMDFNSAANIFEQKIIQFNEPQVTGPCACDSIAINIDNVSLGLLRIKQQNSEGTKSGIYVPVWAFYGIETSKLPGGEMGFSGGDFPEGPYILFAVNAVDGSVINVETGY